MRSLIIISAIAFILSANLQNGCNYLRKAAHQKSIGYSARYVANALEKAGFRFKRQGSGYQYQSVQRYGDRSDQSGTARSRDRRAFE